jgi:hypothetical protein
VDEASPVTPETMLPRRPPNHSFIVVGGVERTDKVAIVSSI